jgi:hypothetical protein
MPFEIFTIPALIFLIVGFVSGLNTSKKDQ